MRYTLIMLIMTIFATMMLPLQAIALDQIDASVVIRLPSKINASQPYKEYFTVKNRNYSSGDNRTITLSIELELANQNGSIYQRIINKTIKSYTRTGFGPLQINDTYNYTICINITPVDFIDPYPLNDEDCREIILGNVSEDNRTANETAENSTSISIADIDLSSDKTIYATIGGYKNGTDKTLISIWLERNGRKYSQVTKLYAEQKHSAFFQRIPVMLKDLEASTNEYMLNAEGLGVTAQKKIVLTGSAVGASAPAPAKDDAKKSLENPKNNNSEKNNSEMEYKIVNASVKAKSAVNEQKIDAEQESANHTSNHTSTSQITGYSISDESWLLANKEKIIFISILVIVAIIIVSKDIRKRLLNKKI